MPEPRHPAATKGDNTEQSDDDYKSTKDYSRRTEREHKDHTGSADDRDGGSRSSTQYASRLREGDTRSGTLTSLPTDKIRTGASNRHDVPAIAALPSPSSEAGKLVPLDISRRSCSSGSTPRLSLSTSPRALRKIKIPPGKTVASSGPDRDSPSTMSPRNVSPRLPAMKSPPSPRKDESIPSMPSIAGPHGKRRVRSLSPKKNSYIDHMEPIHPDKTGTRAGGQFSPLLDAKEEGSRRGAGMAGRDNAGEGKCGREGAVGGHGRLGEPLERSGNFAEAKSEAKDARASRPGSCSPLRSSRGNVEGIRRAHRIEVDEAAAEMPRSARRSFQDSSLGDSYGRGDKSEGAAGSISALRGDESATSPRTRRMRPEHDSGM